MALYLIFSFAATMAMIEGMREQIQGLLMDLGLVERDAHPRSMSNANSDDICVVRCALVSINFIGNDIPAVKRTC